MGFWSGDEGEFGFWDADLGALILRFGGMLTYYFVVASNRLSGIFRNKKASEFVW